MQPSLPVLGKNLLPLNSILARGERVRAEARRDKLEHRGDMLLREPVLRQVFGLRSEEFALLLVGFMGDGEHYLPRQFQAFRNPPCWGQVGMRGAALARGIKGALCNRFRLAGVRERRDFTHRLEKHRRFPLHTPAFRRGRAQPCRSASPPAP